LALVACERPLNEEEEPTATPETPVVPEETQPEATTPATGAEETAVPAPEEPAAPEGEATTPTEGEQGETSTEQPAAPEGGDTTATEAAPAEQPTAAPPPTETAQPAQPGVEQTHVVQAGENLFRIGLQYGCSVLELSTYNGIANPNWISVGQVIRIPATCGG
jgi:LysM repeat protein